ncbi:hypothetical protein ACWGOK_38680 [Streptomyces eurythermus]
MRGTTEAVIGAVTRSLTAPRTVLLGRYDAAGCLQYTGRSTRLSQAVGRALADAPAPPKGAHPWQGWTVSAGRRSHRNRTDLDVTRVPLFGEDGTSV